jgi:hypothetical protein
MMSSPSDFDVRMASLIKEMEAASLVGDIPRMQRLAAEQTTLLKETHGEFIPTKPVARVEHIFGAEPAGAILRFVFVNGEEFNFNLPKDHLIGLRDVIQVVLDHYLPPYPKGNWETAGPGVH